MAAAICCERPLASLKFINVFEGNKEHQSRNRLFALTTQHKRLSLKRFTSVHIRHLPVKGLLQHVFSDCHRDRFSSVFGLRIDVETSPADIERELETLYVRLHCPADALWNLPVIDIEIPELSFWYREADGDHYIYVEDLKRKRLAGYTVFKRLVELDKWADLYLRATHST